MLGPLVFLSPPTMMLRVGGESLPCAYRRWGSCAKVPLRPVPHSSYPVVLSPQAIAHYEQSADYYKGEESNR